MNWQYVSSASRAARGILGRSTLPSNDIIIARWAEYCRALPPIPFADLSLPDVDRLMGKYLDGRPRTRLTVDVGQLLINLGFIISEEELERCAIMNNICTRQEIDAGKVRMQQRKTGMEIIRTDPIILHMRLATRLTEHIMDTPTPLRIADLSSHLFPRGSFLLAVCPYNTDGGPCWEDITLGDIEQVVGIFRERTNLDTELMWHFDGEEFGPEKHGWAPFDKSKVLGPLVNDVRVVA